MRLLPTYNLSDFDDIFHFLCKLWYVVTGMW